MINQLREDIKKLVDPERAKNLSRYFKCRDGEYGEGDCFLGITVPQIRKLVRIYRELSFSDIDQLLHSKFHEERLLGLLILVEQFQKANPEKQKEIFEYYLVNTKYINNWDLVDLSAPKIVGPLLSHKNKSILIKLAHSKNLWERRIAVLSTFGYIRVKHFKTAFRIARILIQDKEDLIHKAVGWMLREIGKRDLKTEEEFLQKYAQIMPRMMLRYAIEKFSEEKRQKYLKF